MDSPSPDKEKQKPVSRPPRPTPVNGAKNGKRWKTRIVPLTILIALIALLIYGFMPKPLPMEMGKVTRGLFSVTVDEEGKTRIRQRYVISTPVSGRLRRIAFKVGDKVEAQKTVLATVDPNSSEMLDPRSMAEAEARLKTATATVEQAQANRQLTLSQLKFAKIELERGKKLLTEKVISQQEFDAIDERNESLTREAKTAETTITVATFEREQAKATLDQGPNSTGHPYEIISPVSGQVLKVEQESETAVHSGQTLLEVGDATDLEIVVDVLSRDAVRMGPGTKMLLEHWGGTVPLEARVRLIEPAGFTKTSALGVDEQRVNVVADIVDPVEKRGGLGDAFRVEARIFVRSEENILKVPSSALFREGNDWMLYEVVNGKAMLRTLQIGENNGTEAEALKGISEGAEVILHPSDKLANGVLVKRQDIR